jgi:hypothetical protein
MSPGMTRLPCAGRAPRERYAERDILRDLRYGEHVGGGS